MFKFSSTDFQMPLADGTTLIISHDGSDGKTANVTITDERKRIISSAKSVPATDVSAMISGSAPTKKGKSPIPRMGARFGANAIGNKVGEKMKDVREKRREDSDEDADNLDSSLQPNLQQQSNRQYGGISDDIDTDDSTNYQAPVEEERVVTEYFNRSEETKEIGFEPLAGFGENRFDTKPEESGYKYMNEVDVVINGVVDGNTYKELMRIRNSLIETNPEVVHTDIQQFVQLNFALPNASRCSFVANTYRATAILDSFYMEIKEDLQQSLGVKSVQLAKRSAENRDDRQTIHQFSEMPIHVVAEIDRGSETDTDIAILRILESTVSEFQTLYFEAGDQAPNATAEPLAVNIQTDERDYKIHFIDALAATIYMQHSRELSKALYRTNFTVNIHVETLRVEPAKGKRRGRQEAIPTGITIRGNGNFEISVKGDTTPQLKKTLQRTVDTLEETYARYRFDEATSSTAFGGLQFEAFQTQCLIKPLNQKAYSMLDKVASNLVTSFQKIGATNFEPVPLQKAQ